MHQSKFRSNLVEKNSIFVTLNSKLMGKKIQKKIFFFTDAKNSLFSSSKEKEKKVLPDGTPSYQFSAYDQRHNVNKGQYLSKTTSMCACVCATCGIVAEPLA